MADIKTRDAVKGTIKTLDKAAIAGRRMKSAYAKTKDKAEQGYYAEENSPTEYAADKVSHASGRIKDEGIHQFNKQGQKNAQITKENIGKAVSDTKHTVMKRSACCDILYQNIHFLFILCSLSRQLSGNVSDQGRYASSNSGWFR